MSSRPFEDLARSVERVAGELNKAREAASGGITESSAAGSEIKLDEYSGTWSKQPLRDAYCAAVQVFTASLDHLRALSILLRADDVIVAPSVVSRAALEAAALAHHLASPDIGPKVRLLRSMNYRLANIHELAKMTDTPQDRDRAKATIERIAASGATHGFTFRPPKNGYAPNFRPGSTNTTDVIKELLDYADDDLGVFYWRHLSSVAHSRGHGLNAFLVPLLGSTDHSETTGIMTDSAEGAARKLFGGPLAVLECARRIGPHLGWDLAAFRGAAQTLIHIWMRIGNIPGTP